MPQARTDVDRDTKIAQILDAAEARLLAGGYEAMSVAGIARELHLAQNSIYWYFASKGDLFVGVLERILGRLAAKKPPKERGLLAQVLWAADRMYDLAPLRAQLAQRAAHSDKAARFQTELDELVRRLLIHGIESYVEPELLDVAASAFLATVEGTFGLKLSRSERHRIISFALERITGAPNL